MELVVPCSKLEAGNERIGPLSLSLINAGLMSVMNEWMDGGP